MDARSLIAAAKRDAPLPAVETAVLGALGLGGAAFVAPSLAWRLWSALKHAAISKAGVSVIAVAAASGGYAAGRMQERALHESVSAKAQVAERRVAMSGSSITSAPITTTSVTSTPITSMPVTSTPITSTPITSTIVDETAAAATVTERARPVREIATTRATAATATSTPETEMTTPSPTARESLADELDAIRRARTALLAGNDRDALVALDAYDAAHPHGTLEEESLALRVRATRKLGDDVAAAKALADLETRFPTSVQLSALRAAH